MFALLSSYTLVTPGLVLVWRRWWCSPHGHHKPVLFLSAMSLFLCFLPRQLLLLGDLAQVTLGAELACAMREHHVVVLSRQTMSCACPRACSRHWELLLEGSFVGFSVNGANVTMFRNALGSSNETQTTTDFLVSRKFFGNASPSSAEMDQRSVSRGVKMFQS